MANKYTGRAADLQISISAVYTTIAQIRDMVGPTMSMNALDVSTRDVSWKEYIAGQRDGGEVKFDCVFDSDSATHSATVVGGFIKSLVDGSVGLYKLLFADGTPVTASFSALVVKVEPKDPYDGVQTADVTLKITGAITFA